MASLPGGPADKLGNEFERLWTVHHLIEVIAGRALSVLVEALGYDEKGVEFWVTRPDGTREAHQCKRENGSRGPWTIAALRAKDVLQHAKFQLERSAQHRFVFVSDDKAVSIKELCERASRGDGADRFVAHCANDGSLGLRKEFPALCSVWGLSMDIAEHRVQVHDLLRRLRPTVKDKDALRREVELLASGFISGDPAVVVACLESMLSRNASMGGELVEHDILAALPPGSRPRDLGKDATLPSRIANLIRRFQDSYADYLILGKIIVRDETNEALRHLMEPGQSQVLFIHGTAGTGKSGVAYELVRRLTDEGTAVLPLRFDRDLPDDSPTAFGAKLDLPASPSACLASVANGGLGVLLLDQLDAIRWTTAHSSHAWDTCQRLVEEAVRHPNLRVVVVCRTFDALEDRRIALWKEKLKVHDLQVQLLSEAAVDSVLKQTNVSPASIGDRQRQLLRSPQLLYLWSDLRERSPDTPVFRNRTDLMRLYWRSIRARLQAMHVGNCDEVLASAVDYLNRRGTLQIPGNYRDKFQHIVDALISEGVLRLEPSGKMLFAHQSSLDHLTAEYLLEQMRGGQQTIGSWLRIDEQSLFRRNQVRELLFLLRDSEPDHYKTALYDLLTGPTIRFHLQHVALRVLGASEPPNEIEIGLVTELLSDPVWFPHVRSLVLYGNVNWFDALLSGGIFEKWLIQADTVRTALWLVESVFAHRAQSIRIIMQRSAKRIPDLWARSVIYRSKPHELDRDWFACYVRLVRRGEGGTAHFLWREVSQAQPDRAFLLLRARLHHLLSTLNVAETSGERFDPLLFRTESTEALISAARRKPQQAWKALVPTLAHIAKLRRRVWRGRKQGEFFSIQTERWIQVNHLARLLTQLLCAAAESLSQQEGDQFWTRIAAFSNDTLALQRVAAAGLRRGPLHWADRVLTWLLADKRRFHCGTVRYGVRYGGRLYLPARRLIRRYSRHASSDSVAQLLTAIQAYRPARELRDYRTCCELNTSSQGGGWLHQRTLFLGQYLLLEAVPKRCLPPTLQDGVGVLQRKFGTPASLIKEPKSGFGGTVGSTIPTERLEFLSDRHWLSIVKSVWPAHRRRLRVIGPSRLGEVRTELFARDLAAMARKQPTRFARLAIRFPLDIDLSYPAELMRQLAEKSPPTQDLAPTWQPASTSDIEQVFSRFGLRMDDQDHQWADAVSWMLLKRPGETWSEATLNIVVHVATSHPHPGEGEYTVSSSAGNDGTDKHLRRDVEASGRNCSRGTAAHAIGALLHADPGRLQLLQPAMDALARDPHPAVRCAATAVCIPLLNCDQRLAVNTFSAIVSHPEDAILTGHYVDEFLSYTLLDYWDELRPIVDRMFKSDLAEVAQHGAKWLAAASIYGKLTQAELQPVHQLRISQRVGIAEGLAGEICRGHGDDSSVDLLTKLFEDSEKKVRSSAAAVFRLDDVFSRQPLAITVADRFVNSPAFDDNLSTLLYSLKDFPGDLRRFSSAILGAVTKFNAPAQATDAFKRHSDADLLTDVLLRLYDQSDHDAALRKSCLDAWDAILKEQLDFDFLKHLDA